MATAKQLYDAVLELVGLETMSEDSGIIFDNGKDIKKILAGVDMDAAMTILAKQLGYDCVVRHHPAGIMNPNIGDLFGRDHMHKMMECGVPINVAQKIGYKNEDKRKKASHPRNKTIIQDTARLLDINDMAYHTPADMLAERAAQKVMNELMESNPRCTVEDVINELLKIREYKEALEGQGPEVWVGTKKSFAGKIYVQMYGVGAPSVEEYIAEADAGVGTFICMHATPEVIEGLQKYGKCNLVIAGHMASDSLGMNQIFAKWEEMGVEITKISGLV